MAETETAALEGSEALNTSPRRAASQELHHVPPQRDDGHDRQDVTSAPKNKIIDEDLANIRL
jgi:hypothetical protein